MKPTSTPASSAAAPRLNYPTVAPAVFHALRQLQQTVNDSGLESSLLELVKLRVSQLNGCAFCIDLHFSDALKAGESARRLSLLDAWQEAPCYTPRERAALAWAETLTRLAGAHVSDDDFTAVRAEFSESELAHLTLAIVAINGWNRFGVGFRMPLRAET